ncbi:hypothetical protein [Entomobacter blattae]|uniref:Uncharacterized protein n=1 Tax=Entomobacter blattae TaxID=2762277 RepID=A0A7H1NQY2_9PROT|nr:hypothetical protein [Entomobacter blattae]QNT78192.1 hypothetical protein JGUZn3_09610 [Entomobacter blattae]
MAFLMIKDSAAPIRSALPSLVNLHSPEILGEVLAAVWVKLATKTRHRMLKTYLLSCLLGSPLWKPTLAMPCALLISLLSLSYFLPFLVDKEDIPYLGKKMLAAATTACILREIFHS